MTSQMHQNMRNEAIEKNIVSELVKDTQKAGTTKAKIHWNRYQRILEYTVSGPRATIERSFHNVDVSTMTKIVTKLCSGEEAMRISKIDITY